MFFAVVLAVFVSASARDLLEPRLQVLSPNELVIKVPLYEGAKLVTFRIGVRRKDRDLEDLERGQNQFKDGHVFIYDERLDLKRGDVINYLLGYRDSEGYHAKTGQHVFDGVYHKQPQQRRRRNATPTPAPTTTQPPEEDDNNSGSSEEFDPTQSRFGGGGYNHGHHRGHHRNHRRGRWHGSPRYGPGYGPGYGSQHNDEFNPFRPPHYDGPPFQHHGYPPHYGPPPPFGHNCEDHRHDLCHRGGVKEGSGGDWPETTTPRVTTTSTTTSTQFPDIDIRFSSDD